MPTALAHPCVDGCPLDARTCPHHGRHARAAANDRRRGNFRQRGYTTRWDHHRKTFIDEQFRLEVPRAGLCGARLPGALTTNDSECARLGVIVAGRVADHIEPVTGPDDPTFWELTALQFLCARCDAAKRAREQRAGIHR